jgi:protein-tyrosine phosphatase
MAEYIFNNLADTDYQVESAGISALEGEDAAPQAQQVMKEKGIDISEHEAKKLTEEMVEEAALILAMTYQHKKSISSVFPESKGKVFTLKEFAEGSTELGKSTEKLQQIHRKISNKRENFLERKGSKIEGLRKQHQQLMQQIGEIEDELNSLEEELSKEIAKDKKELRKLQNKIQDLDIRDPFGQPIAIYRQCAKEIEKNIKLTLEKLKN